MTGPQPRPPLSAAGLSRLSDREFVELWTEIAGEPPSIMVDRDEMIALLLDLAADDRASASDRAARG